MEKKPFLTEAMAQEIIQDVPTPFHVYDEKGIRENARRINKAFSWNKGFKEYFAVKALPNPVILQILQEEGCGVDCSSLTELMLSEVCGFTGSDIMFSSNQTPVEDMQKAYELGAYINLDDATMVDFLDRVAGVPETVFCRYNPGGTFSLGESEDIGHFVRVRAAAVLNEICNPVDEHRGFTAAGTGQQQQWAFRSQDRLSLHIVQVRKVRRDKASARLHIPLFKSQSCSIHSV